MPLNTPTRERPRSTAGLLLVVVCWVAACGGRVPVARGGTPDPYAETGALAAAVFARGSGGLSEQDQADIVHALGLLLAAAGTVVDPVCGQPVSPELGFPDLDSDGSPEVVVQAGNTCLSGMAGTSVWVFVRDASGRFQSNLGFPGLIAEVLPSRSRGFSDLLIGGPGFCFPVWRWDGREYAYLRSDPQAPGGCDNR
jgi:hypothetical protein